MADAKLTRTGINAAVAAEEAAAPVAENTAPNVSERRVVGKREYPAPDGSVIVVEHL